MRFESRGEDWAVILAERVRTRNRGRTNEARESNKHRRLSEAHEEISAVVTLQNAVISPINQALTRFKSDPLRRQCGRYLGHRFGHSSRKAQFICSRLPIFRKTLALYRW